MKSYEITCERLEALQKGPLGSTSKIGITLMDTRELAGVSIELEAPFPQFSLSDKRVHEQFLQFCGTQEVQSRSRANDIARDDSSDLASSF